MFRFSSAAAAASLVTMSIAETITGTIYCDNQFEFYFNGVLIASDPIAFTPHQAVQVSFDWDGVSDKVFAISCQDYASTSGYEYIDTTSPQLGDGALIAEFSDGTITSSSWKYYVTNYGPTDASIAAGCSATNLAACAVQDNGTPANWFSTSFDDSTWTTSTTYTSAQAGWGAPPTWSGTECCTMTSPLDRSTLGCSVDSSGTAITVTESECQNPSELLGSSTASFIWGTDLERDNKVLFRYTATASSSSTTPAPPTPSPTTVDTDDDDKAGLIVGVVLGSVAFLVIVIVLLYCFCCKSKPEAANDSENNPDTA
eukprot:TRINITY_DN7791_c3_g1_i1.p1 TRINITY_DN7791_c3_g1~~TRINITY_DN7791_c3_g1_i1.p1  ORF type:complete len:314 (+),score=65.04 TRINITY_DN7791_c3_g1_i1:77-1018(+)